MSRFYAQVPLKSAKVCKKPVGTVSSAADCDDGCNYAKSGVMKATGNVRPAVCRLPSGSASKRIHRGDEDQAAFEQKIRQIYATSGFTEQELADAGRRLRFVTETRNPSGSPRRVTRQTSRRFWGAAPASRSPSPPPSSSSSDEKRLIVVPPIVQQAVDAATNARNSSGPSGAGEQFGNAAINLLSSVRPSQQNAAASVILQLENKVESGELSATDAANSLSRTSASDDALVIATQGGGENKGEEGEENTEMSLEKYVPPTQLARTSDRLSAKRVRAPEPESKTGSDSESEDESKTVVKGQGGGNKRRTVRAGRGPRKAAGSRYDDQYDGAYYF
jgi:hypothetical protein